MSWEVRSDLRRTPITWHGYGECFDQAVLIIGIQAKQKIILSKDGKVCNTLLGLAT